MPPMNSTTGQRPTIQRTIRTSILNHSSSATSGCGAIISSLLMDGGGDFWVADHLYRLQGSHGLCEMPG